MSGRYLTPLLLVLALASATRAAIFNVNFENMTAGASVVADSTPDPEPAVNLFPNVSTNWNGTNLGNLVQNGFTDTGGTGNTFGTGKVAVITDANTGSATSLYFQADSNPTTSGKMVVTFDCMFQTTGQSGNLWATFVNSSSQTIFQIMSNVSGSNNTISLFEFATPGGTSTQYSCGTQPMGQTLSFRVEIDFATHLALVKVNGVQLTSGAKNTFSFPSGTNFSGTRFFTSGSGTRTMALDNFVQQVEQTGLTIFSGGASTYQIYYAAGSPQSVIDAANDLKAVIQAATNPDINLVITTTVPSGNMICLGDNATATAAGATLTGIPTTGGFRIKTVGSNLYILGIDTPSSPTNTTTAEGGFLRGTRDGVSYLWEQYLSARYLIPGPDGLDVAIQTTMTVPAQDTIKSPTFPGRVISYMGETPNQQNPSSPNEVDKWAQRNRIGTYMNWDHAHAWSDYPSQTTLNNNPAYMAQLSSGSQTRQDPHNPPTLPTARKYCTTNTGLQTAFASALNDKFNADGAARKSASLSPTDGVGGCFCTSPNCAALITVGNPGDYQTFGDTRSKQILTWYNSVATSFYNSYPAYSTKKLCGYLYEDYTIPPATEVPLDSRVQLHYAPLWAYGMLPLETGKLASFQADLANWGAMYPGQINYSDYPMFGNYPYSGTPIPPGTGVFDAIFTSLQGVNSQHTIFNSNSSWGWVGLKNYCIARKLWDNSLSITALRTEFMTRCYGAGSATMDSTYNTLESSWTTYMNTRPQSPSTPDRMTDLTDMMIAAVYGPNWATLESNYFAAKTAITNSSDPNKQAQLNRLDMWGRNLAVLHYRLRHKLNPGMNTTPYNNGAGTGFYMDDATFASWVTAHATDIAMENNWNNVTTGIMTFKDFRYNVTHDDMVLSAGQKVTVPINSASNGVQIRVNGQSGFTTSGVQVWADYHDSVNGGSPSAKNQLVFTGIGSGTVGSVTCSLGEHDCAVLGTQQFTGNFWVDSGGSVANVENIIFKNLQGNANTALLRLNLATNTIEALGYTAPGVVAGTGSFTPVASYTRGTLLSIKAKFYFSDVANPRVEYYVNNNTSTPNATLAFPKWGEVRSFVISSATSTTGKMAVDDLYFGP